MATESKAKRHPPYAKIIRDALKDEGQTGMSLATMKKRCSDKYGTTLKGGWEHRLLMELNKMEEKGEIVKHSKHHGHFVMKGGATPAKGSAKKAAAGAKAGKKATGGRGGKKAKADDEEDLEGEEEEEEEMLGAAEEPAEEEEEMEGLVEEEEEEPVEEEEQPPMPEKKGASKAKAQGKSPKRAAAGAKGGRATQAKRAEK